MLQAEIEIKLFWKSIMKKILLILMLMLSPVAIWADSKTVTFTAGKDFGSQTATGHKDQLSKDGISVTSANGTFGRTDIKYYTANSGNPNKTTFSSSIGNITKVVITCKNTGATGPIIFQKPSNGKYTYSGNKGTWKGNSSSFTLDNISSVQFTQVEVTVNYQVSFTVSSVGYVTYAAPVATDYTSLSGVEAFAVKLSDDNSIVNLTPITGPVAANTPVLIKAPQGTYLVPSSDASTIAYDNDLKVSDGTATTDATHTLYVLAKHNGEVGFYKLAAGTIIPSGKCYLEIPASSAAKPDFISFPGSSTGISGITRSAIKQADGSSKMFNLAGQRVGKGYRGIVIVNGRKMVIK